MAIHKLHGIAWVSEQQAASHEGLRWYGQCKIGGVRPGADTDSRTCAGCCIILGYCATSCSAHTPETSGTSAISKKNEESPQVRTNMSLSTSAFLHKGCFTPRWGYPLTGVRMRSCLLQTDVRLKHLFGQIGWSSRPYAVQQPWRGLNVPCHVNGAVEFQCPVACAYPQTCCYVVYTGSLFYQTPVASSCRPVTLT